MLNNFEKKENENELKLSENELKWNGNKTNVKFEKINKNEFPRNLKKQFKIHTVIQNYD